MNSSSSDLMNYCSLAKKKKLMYGEYVGEVICGFPLYKREDLVYKEPIGDALM